MTLDAAHLAARLAENAEAVCKTYLSQGRRCGNYWLVGDAFNNPGRSLFVRLAGPARGPGAAGKWTDAASGEHGDLLDLIGLNQGLAHLADTLAEARRFLSLPAPAQPPSKTRRNSPEAARRLFQLGRPVERTLAETYLRARGITAQLSSPPLRFHPECYYRETDTAPLQRWPAMLAAVTDLAGNLTGVHRTYLARDGSAKAPIDDPRRAMGHLLGHGVRFGLVRDVLAAGEGLETMLALRSLLPALPVIAALSANHLPALILQASLQRLYIASDSDAAGEQAAARLEAIARAAGIAVRQLRPPDNDWNDALRLRPRAQLHAALLCQLFAEDAELAQAA